MTNNADIVVDRLKDITTIPQDVLAQAAKLAQLADAVPGLGVTIVFSIPGNLDQAVPLLSGGVPFEEQLPVTLNNLLQGAAMRGVPVAVLPAPMTADGQCDCPKCRARREAAQPKVVH